MTNFYQAVKSTWQKLYKKLNNYINRETLRRLKRRRGIRIVGCLLLAWIALHVLVPKPDLFGSGGFSQAVYDNHDHLLRITLARDGVYRLPVPLSDISPQFIDATLLYEDRYFYWHPGVNPVAILRAIWQTYIRHGPRVGGSTITMQLARLRFKLRTRTIPGKLVQILRALQLELHYSKKQILHAYLSLAPYGGNIEGVAAASLIYFDKPATRLSLPESIALAVIPQNPGNRLLNTSGHAAGARQRLIDLWIHAHASQKGNRSLLALPLSARGRNQLPFLAPHFVDSLVQDYPHKVELHSTLDLEMQNLVERTVAAYMRERQHTGIRNVSILIADTRDMGIKAEMGSADFFNPRIDGQVNGTRARRSPGSTLKHPLTMLKDAPTRFGAYNPENFDKDFVGPIPAWEALVRSRNVPAVYLASHLHEPDLYGFLQQAGMNWMQPEDYYGLALVLGGAEFKMEELVSMYAMLSNGGRMSSLRRLKSDPRQPGQTLLSPQASYLTLWMLRKNPRPTRQIRRDWLQHPLAVAWKTGTSHGFRDAWSFGVVGPYVIGVWVGNFDGRGSPDFIGRKAAGPLLFHLIDALRAVGRLNFPDPTPPLGIEQVEVCAISGGIPTRFSPQTVKTLFIPGKSPIAPCRIHRQVWVDIKTGLQACSPESPGAQAKVYEFWPSDLMALFDQAGLPRRRPPKVNPACPAGVQSVKGVGPQITSPVSELVYQLHGPPQQWQSIPLTAVTDADTTSLHWFLDDRYLGKAKSGQALFWKPRPGNFVLRAIDDRGRSDATDLSVALGH